MKVSELQGALLDYWVAKAEGADATISRRGECLVCEDGVASYRFKPSTTWATGGPIIERELIEVMRPTKGEHVGSWAAWIEVDQFVGYGPAPLVAAMRAYVASKFGAEVPEVPA
jgi:hypothetical protein